MSYDVVALIDGRPSYQDVLAGMVAAGPDWLVREVSDSAVLQLCDPQGQPLASLEAPILIQVPGEVERLLGPEVSGVQTPVWWAEVRATPQDGAPELADKYAATLVERLGGQVWKPAPDCRRRAPKPTWLVVAGGKDGLSSMGSVEIHRRPAGLEEVITLAVATPEGLPSPADVQQVAEKLADSFTMVSFFAQGARGGTDTNAMPHWTGVPAPMAMAVGNDALQGDGLAKALDVTGVADITPVKIGPAASPVVWYPIGDGKSQLDWNIYSALLGRLVPPGAPVRA